MGALSLVLYTAFNNLALALLFLHRVCFTPATLSSYYWEYFSANPHVMLSDSILASFFPRNYDKNVGPLIGEVYFQSDVMNATTGIWAQGFAHFGYAGMIAASLCVAALFWVVDSISDGDRLVVGALMMALIGVFWANVALHTSLISNGILVTILLLYLMPNRKRKEPSLA
jgi:hypothetical protein